MTARRILAVASVLALCLGACSSAGTVIGSSGSHSVAVPAPAAPNRTVILDPSTGKVVAAGVEGSDHIVVMNPATGQIVEHGDQKSVRIVIMNPATGQIVGVSN